VTVPPRPTWTRLDLSFLALVGQKTELGIAVKNRLGAQCDEIPTGLGEIPTGLGVFSR
jgi:hypothetical protein